MDSSYEGEEPRGLKVKRSTREGPFARQQVGNEGLLSILARPPLLKIIELVLWGVVANWIREIIGERPKKIRKFPYFEHVPLIF